MIIGLRRKSSDNTGKSPDDPMAKWPDLASEQLQGQTTMHSTPDIPGTSPVTDNPNPGGDQGMDPYGPGTDNGKPGEKLPPPDAKPKPQE
ncbi:MAG TPA: hypothetical protein VN577_12200 [Terriglobales bacterium]|nr:hypothetical protein [Terriglobales bacterium]